MDHFVSTPIELPPVARDRGFQRADLVFYEVDARGASFTARVFLDSPDVSPDTSPVREDGYAGFFVIFGHGGCFGDPGHCDFELDRRDPFDRRPPHPLTPQTKLVDITDRLRAVSGTSIIVTVLAVVPGHDGPQLADVLQFGGLRLLTYNAAAGASA